MLKTIRKALWYLLIVGLLLTGTSALAAKTGELSVKLTADPEKGFTRIGGGEFKLFQVGEPADTETAWGPTQAFSASAAGLKEKPAKADAKQWSDEEVRAIIEKVKTEIYDTHTHVQRITEDYSAVTDSTGVASFKNLKAGIYFVWKNPDTLPRRLEVLPFLVAVPSVGTENPYSVNVDLKNAEARVKYVYDAPKPIEIPVTKDWVDDDNFDGIQPDSVTVRLHRFVNGKEDTSFEEKTMVLDAKNNWQGKWENLPSENEDEVAYTYTVTEEQVPGYTTTIVGGRIVNRHQPEYGAIKVTKAVRVNGKETADKQADGTYHFTITGPTDADYVKPKTKTAGNHLDNYPFEIKITDGKSNYWAYDRLMPGTYTIKEVVTEDFPKNMTLLDDKGQPTTQYERTVKVEANTTTEKPVELTFINNKQLGSLKITKHVTVNSKSTTGTSMDGLYHFTVKGPSFPNGEEVAIRIKNGASNSVQLHDLEFGEYTVTEDQKNLPRDDIKYVKGDNNTPKTVTVANNDANPVTFEFTNNRTEDDNPPPPPPSTTTQAPPPSPPVVQVSISGVKIWHDEKNIHNTRPASITVQLLRDGEKIQEITVSGAGNQWRYDFGKLPKQDENGKDYRYTVRELPVEGYTTKIKGTVITNELERQPSKTFTSFNGNKVWVDNENAEGTRPTHIIIRLMRNGREVDRRTVTAANGWQFSFQNVPVDDGYGNKYNYSIREDAVEGYIGRASRFIMTNNRAPEKEVLTEFAKYGTPLAGFNEEELEDLLELYDYGTPLWGRPLKTGDEVPIYPIVFGGIGAAALIALVILLVINKKRGGKAA